MEFKPVNSPHNGLPMKLIQNVQTFTYRGEEITITLLSWLCEESGLTYECGNLLDWNLNELKRCWREKRINKII